MLINIVFYRKVHSESSQLYSQFPNTWTRLHDLIGRIRNSSESAKLILGAVFLQFPEHYILLPLNGRSGDDSTGL